MPRRSKGKIIHSVTAFVVWTFGASAVSVTAQTQSSEQAQVEKGRQAVGQVCAACHNNIMRMIQIHRKTAVQWKDTVYSMIGRGALILPEEIAPLTAFLAATAGPNSPRTTTSPAQTSAQGPASEGRAILERSCQTCHDLQIATKKPAGQDWNAVVDKMAIYGANLTAADRQTLLEHLNKLTNQ